MQTELAVKKLRAELENNVEILAATKSVPLDEIRRAVLAGIRIIGENYVQEAAKKYSALHGIVKMHCIGHLQKNKIRKAVETFDMIQTVDNPATAQLISVHCAAIKKNIPVLIQLNIASEPNKHGCLPGNLNSLAAAITHLPNVKLRGLMVTSPKADELTTLSYFKKAKSMFDGLAKDFKNFDTLSMGMSDSYHLAISSGSTMVRIGRLIFGTRAH